MGLFLENGYIDMLQVMTDDLYPFTIITGARGTGKTYGALKNLMEMRREGKINKFFHLRRTEREMEKIVTEPGNNFKRINHDTGSDVQVGSIGGDMYGYFEDDEVIGYIGALSTFRNLRGLDFSDVDVIFYDECIPETNAKPIKDEAKVLFNMYETVNRNRELTGLKPCKLICASNSNELGNPLFMELEIIPQVEKLALKGGGTFRDKSRGLKVIILKDSPISEAKKNTALYKLTGGGSFADMALDNKFADNDRDGIRPQKLDDYVSDPVARLDGVAIYRHKSVNRYYACTYTGPADYTTSARDIQRYRLRHYRLYNRYVDGQMLFDSYLTKRIFLHYNNIR